MQRMMAERYRLDALVARGGMSEIWRATDLGTGAVVAVKRLLGWSGVDEHAVPPDDDLRQRLMREAEALGCLAHPNIVRYLGSGLEPRGEPYLVLELLEGEDLARRQARDPLEMEQGLEVVRQALEGLELCHAQGVVHRDIKPSNLFLVRSDGDRLRVKLVDFGLVWLKDHLSRLTRSGVVVGTLHYLSPEQVTAATAVDHRTDLYALGVVLYQLVTGQLPFPAVQPTAVMLQIVSETPPLPSLLRPDLPPWLEEAILRAMMRSPADRFQSATEMRAALSTAAGRRSVLGKTLPPEVTISARQVPDGQRRTVSLLCVDLPEGQGQGEDAGEVRDAIEAAGGTIQHLISGRVIGVFGLDRISGDEAQRALGAGLKVRETIQGLPRLLVATAKVEDRGEGGQAVTFSSSDLDRASRSLARVPPGELVVDEVTRDLVERVETRVQIEQVSRHLSVVRDGSSSPVPAGAESGLGTMPEQRDSLVGQVLRDTYRITRKIAAGGMGVVYEAVHVRLGKQRFAVKLLHAAIAESEEVYARFRREAEIATELGHPNIVYVLDFDVTEQGQPYLVMEYLEGEDMGSRLHHGGRMTLGELLPVLEQVGGALEAAHDKGIVHRDMKPENIFLVRPASAGKEPLVKVLDFGISKIRHSKSVVTRDHAFLGTTYYMSPEQAEGLVHQIDHTTDIFSLGTICYEALTGVLPFSAPSIPSTLYQICHHRPRPVTSINPALPAGVDDLLSRAMAKERGERYQQVSDFVQDLRRCLVAPGGEAREPAPVTMNGAVKEPGGADTARTSDLLEPRPTRRKGLAALAGGVAVLLLVAGGIYMIATGTSPDKGQAVAGPGDADTLPSDSATVIAVHDAGAETRPPDGPVRSPAPKSEPERRPAIKKKKGRPRPKRPAPKKPAAKKEPEFLFDNP